MVGYGKLIREARHLTGLTQLELAEKMGIDRTIVSRMETGHHMPTWEQVRALVSILPLSGDELLRRMDLPLNQSAASRLPKGMVDDLLALEPRHLQTIAELAQKLRPPAPGSNGRL